MAFIDLSPFVYFILKVNYIKVFKDIAGFDFLSYATNTSAHKAVYFLNSCLIPFKGRFTMVKKFVVALGFVMAVNGLTFANGNPTLTSSLELEVDTLEVNRNNIVERGVMGDVLGEVGRIADVFEDEGFSGGMRVLGDIVENPNRRWFDSYPRLRAFVNSLRSCLV
jgi:hypothetical protein